MLVEWVVAKEATVCEALADAKKITEDHVIDSISAENV